MPIYVKADKVKSEHTYAQFPITINDNTDSAVPEWSMSGNGQQTAGTTNVPAASATVVSVESGTDYAMFLKTDFPGVAVGDKVNIVAGGSTHSLAVKKIDAQYVYVENAAV